MLFYMLLIAIKLALFARQSCIVRVAYMKAFRYSNIQINIIAYIEKVYFERKKI